MPLLILQQHNKKFILKIKYSIIKLSARYTSLTLIHLVLALWIKIWLCDCTTGLPDLGSNHFQASSEADSARHLFQLSYSFFIFRCASWQIQYSSKKSVHAYAQRIIIINSLCIQSPSVQFCDCSTSPSQSFPPFLGAGLLHSLLLHWVHSVPQADHLLHSVHTPSTTGKGWEKEPRECEKQKNRDGA